MPVLAMTASLGPATVPCLEGIDRVSRRGGTDIGFEAAAVHRVDGTVKQARDVILEAGIVEHGEMRPWRAEIRFGSPQGFKGFATVHESKYSTKSGSAER